MDAVYEVLNTLGRADNEITDAPYWLIIDPKQCMHATVHEVSTCITGPFFCREDAEHYLNGRRYHFSKRAGVYCHSGYASEKYKQFWLSARETIAQQPKPGSQETLTQIADAIEGVVSDGAKWNRGNAKDAFYNLCRQLRALAYRFTK